METAIILSTVAAVASSAMAGVQASQQYSQQAQANKYNATALKQQGISASNVAAGNESAVLRRGAGELGEQAAAGGEADIGTGGSLGQVEKQSATNVRMDALNTWYGGELERTLSFNAANLERYNELINKRNADSALIGGFVGAGTKAVMGGAKYAAYKSGDTNSLLALGGGGGSF